jgi:hypothetical protein
LGNGVGQAANLAGELGPARPVPRFRRRHLLPPDCQPLNYFLLESGNRGRREQLVAQETQQARFDIAPRRTDALAYRWPAILPRAAPIKMGANGDHCSPAASATKDAAEERVRRCAAATPPTSTPRRVHSCARLVPQLIVDNPELRVHADAPFGTRPL